MMPLTVMRAGKDRAVSDPHVVPTFISPFRTLSFGTETVTTLASLKVIDPVHSRSGSAIVDEIVLPDTVSAPVIFIGPGIVIFASVGETVR